MATITRKIVLDTLIKHETLTITDIAKEENLGIVPDEGELRFLLGELKKKGFIQVLHGAEPCTYSITDLGIEEGKRMNAVLAD